MQLCAHKMFGTKNCTQPGNQHTVWAQPDATRSIWLGHCCIVRSTVADSDFVCLLASFDEDFFDFT